MSKNWGIEFRVTSRNLKQFVGDIEEYKHVIEQNAKEITEKAARKAYQYAKQEYANAYYDGVNDVEVTLSTTGGGYPMLEIQGDALPFIEYGTGVHSGQLPLGSAGASAIAGASPFVKEQEHALRTGAGQYNWSQARRGQKFNSKGSVSWKTEEYDKDSLHSRGVQDYWFYTMKPGNKFTAGGEVAYGRANSAITHGNPPNAIYPRVMRVTQEEVMRLAKNMFRKSPSRYR